MNHSVIASEAKQSMQTCGIRAAVWIASLRSQWRRARDGALSNETHSV
jgi:hypothetical protein